MFDRICYSEIQQLIVTMNLHVNLGNCCCFSLSELAILSCSGCCRFELLKFFVFNSIALLKCYGESLNKGLFLNV